MYVGENWRFGAGRRGRRGCCSWPAPAGSGCRVFSAPPVNFNGEPVSSTRIRDLLEAGEIAAANALLGYTYFAHGTVAPGKRLGRTLGFPTLNLPWSPELRPRFGVYAVRVGGPEGGPGLPGVANYGLRPTVEQSSSPLLETHVLGACPFGAGDAITVEWLQFVRPEEKFGSVGELRSRIARDIAEARAAAGAAPPQSAS